MMMNNEQRMYMRKQELSGLKVGDRVRITRTAKIHEGGWNNSWIKEMDKYVGKEGIVLSIASNTSGIEVDTVGELEGCQYPYFVLEKIE